MNWTTRVLAIVLAVVLVGGGVYAAYESGFSNGAQAAVVAGDGPETGTVVIDGWRGSGWHGGFGFLFPILFLFLIFGLFRPRRWGGGHYGGWSNGEPHGGPGWGPPREIMEERMKEWHQRAHNEGDANSPGS